MEVERLDENTHYACKKVLDSLDNHWDGLTVFVDHPEIPMDNNKAERQVRGPVVGRKNYYGSGSDRSGRLENGSEGPIYRVERSPTAEQAEFDREQLAISGPSLGEFEKPRIQNSRRNSKKASSGLAFEVQPSTGFIGDIRRIRQIQRNMLQSGQLDFRREDQRQRKAWRP